MNLNADNLAPTRYSLLSRLHDREDHRSWQDFFDTYWRLIYSVAIQSGLTEQEAQDVVQETVIAVARGIDTFQRDRRLGSFKGWLCNLTRWRVVDQLRKRTVAVPLGMARETATGDGAFDLQQIPDPATIYPESLWDREWEANLFAAALDRVKGQVKEEHYQIFYLYTVKEWPATKVARAMNVSVGQVYLAKHRIAALLKKQIRALEKKSF